jgi:cell wall-associated NlpC family hydrolase
MKNLIVLLFLGILLSSNNVFAQSDTLVRTVFQTAEEEIDSIIAYAKQFIGLKYKYGSTATTGFDCSGFVGHVFSQFGYKLGRSSSDQYKDGILIERKNMKLGDLVFFQEKNRNGTYRINHVGIIISINAENNTFRFIHSCYRGVLIDDSTMEYYFKRFYGIRRIVGNE